jgi:pimeloyl-ACP methyl ester carboxylesterase
LRSCVGGQASVVHQVIARLRSASYSWDRAARPVRFSHIALVGHSFGGLIAEVEAYSFNDIDALSLVGWADQGATPFAIEVIAKALLFCATGGLVGNNNDGAPRPAPSGYAYLGTADEYERAVFFSAPAATRAQTLGLRNANPCGDLDSLPLALVVDALRLGAIKVPVLLASGNNDGAVDPAGVSRSRASFSGSHDVEVKLLDRTSHAITLEDGGPEFAATMDAWLNAKTPAGR